MTPRQREEAAGEPNPPADRAYRPPFATLEGLREYRSARDRFISEREAADLVPEGEEERLTDLRETLREARPAAIEANDISAKFGAPWIPARYYLGFVKDRMLDDDGGRTSVEVRRDSDGRWTVSGAGRRGWPFKEEAVDRYGVSADGVTGADPLRTMRDALNGRSTTIYKRRTAEEVEAGVAAKPDEAMTLQAAQKRGNLEADFREWLFDEDPARADEAAARYNKYVNRYVTPRYDGSYLTFPGMAPGIELHGYQRDAVARILRSRVGTLVAHEVGAGKTYTGIAALHEAKRLGLCAKPLVATPVSVVGYWAREWKRLYPTDRVLAFEGGDARRASEFWRSAATGDWDAVIVPHSRLDGLRLSPEALRDKMGRLEGAWEDGLPSVSFRNGRDLAKERGRLAELADASEAAGDGVTFDGMGFDAIAVDEAQYYKNLPCPSTRGGIRGVPTAGGNGKCTNLQDKLDYLRAAGKGGNIVLMTATPASNSLCEMYVWQKYLAPASLEAEGYANIDSWLNTFGSISREPEILPQGGMGFVDRLRRFDNRQEFTDEIRMTTDVVTRDDLGIDLPDVRVVNVEVQPTRAQRVAFDYIAARARAIKGGSVPPDVDNMLLLTVNAKMVALDPKLLFPNDPSVPAMSGGKVDAVVRTALRVARLTEYDEDGNPYNGVQLVFCDTSTDGSGRWNIQAEIRRRLVEGGMPEAEVVCVTGAMTTARRQRCIDAAAAGEVRILIGSTSTLGTGVNIPTVVATHDVDCPLRAADLEQRMGRIRRQGNRLTGKDWFQPMVFRYITTGSADAWLFEIAGNKAAFGAQVMSNESAARSVSEVSEVKLSLDEAMALASGDPLQKRRLDLRFELDTMMTLKKGWLRQQASTIGRLEDEVRPQLAVLDAERARYAAVAAAARAASDQLAAIGPDGLGELSVTVGDRAFRMSRDGCTAANAAAREAIEKASHAPGSRVALGRALGIEYGVEFVAYTTADGYRSVTGHPCVYLSADGGRTVCVDARHTVSLAKNNGTNGPVMDAVAFLREVPGIEERRARASAVKERQVSQMEDGVYSGALIGGARVAVGDVQASTPARDRGGINWIRAPWPRENELAVKRNELDALPVEAAHAEDERAPQLEDVRIACGGEAAAIVMGD